jgi:hypothetical protein
VLSRLAQCDQFVKITKWTRRSSNSVVRHDVDGESGLGPKLGRLKLGIDSRMALYIHCNDTVLGLSALLDAQVKNTRAGCR